MKAVIWQAKGKVSVETVPGPVIKERSSGLARSIASGAMPESS
jgi:Alcohol dehydrogenase GroES-associated